MVGIFCVWSLLQELVNNKRDLTCLLSYLQRSIKFWNDCVFRKFNDTYLRWMLGPRNDNYVLGEPYFTEVWRAWHF
jgi:hypothetical protein